MMDMVVVGHKALQQLLDRSKAENATDLTQKVMLGKAFSCSKIRAGI